MNFKDKVIDWKNRLKDRHMFSIIIGLIIVCLILGGVIYKKQKEYRQVMENQYNLAFFELVDYVQNVENYLAKSLISTSPEHGAETLTKVWKEANLAQIYLSQLPINNEGLSNTARFLNQVSDYSYSLSRKNINHDALTQEDLDNLEELHNYCVELQNTLNQLSTEMTDGTISWKELTKKGSTMFAQQVSNNSKDSFSNIDSNFGEYAGLIYDGAYSEHIDKAEKRGLTGDDVSEEQAKEIAISLIGSDRIQDINSNGFSENGNIPSYSFSITLKDNDKNNPISISISKKGGHIIFMNHNRNITAETISQDDANKIGKDFLTSKGYANMKETYYIKQDGIVTINYAYSQNDVTIYPDLIKLKIALDNGEILGMETTGYLNSHTERTIPTPTISMDEAKSHLNSKLEITSEGFAIIPTEWKTEVFCYEFKGKVNNTDFLVYINAETGKEENILVIINTPNGTLTM